LISDATVSALPSITPTMLTEAPSVPTRNSGSSGAMISLDASVRKLTTERAITLRPSRAVEIGVTNTKVKDEANRGRSRPC